MSIKEQKYTNMSAASQALAENLSDILRKAISLRGRALLAVSGGRSPRYVFECLNQKELDWDKITVTLTDERWVTPDHPESNENLVRSYLLRKSARAVNFVPLFGDEESPEAGHAACESRLKNITLPFDAVYLGMGTDGHFASLFPSEPEIDVSNNLCTAIPSRNSRLPRMSLTFPTIINTNNIFLLFSGNEKYKKYNEAKESGNYKDLPLRLILSQEQAPVHVLYAR